MLDDWDGVAENRALAEKAAQEFENVHHVIRYGGQGLVSKLSSPITFPGVHEESVINAMDRVAIEWLDVKIAAVKALQADADSLLDNEGYQAFQEETHQAFAAMNEAVFQMQIAGETKVSHLGAVIVSAVVATLFVLIGAIYFVRNRIIHPFEHATTAVRESARRLQQATEGTQDGLWVWDLQDDTVWYSKRFWILLGFPADGPFPEPVFASFEKRLHPEDVAKVFHAVEQHLKEGKLCDINYRLQTELGDYRWFRARGIADFDERGTPIRMAGSIQDITRQVTAERDIRESEAFLRSVLDGQTAQIAILDETGEIQTINKAWRRYAQEFPGQDPVRRHRNYLTVLDRQSESPNDDAIVIANKIRRVLAGESYFESHTYACHSATARCWFSVAITPIYAEKPGVVVAHNNVTDLIEAQNAAQSASVAKSEFLANMSHEIRTPLTAILGFVETLAEHNEEPEKKLAVSTIQRNGKHLLGIVNDILDLSKVEAGKVVIDIAPTNIFQLIHEVQALMKVQADGRGIDLRIGYSTPIPETIHTDATRLRQILINLIGNALKFTEIGGVTVEVAFENTDTGAIMQFDVTDTGIGMTPAQIAKLFKPFNQADASTTRRFGGTGLGLTLSKRFAEVLGGSIAVTKSTISVGTTFRATVSCGEVDLNQLVENPTAHAKELAHREATKKPPSESIEGMRILYAEDGPDNQRLVSHILKKASADVTVVENGELAVNTVVQQQQADNPYDVILMDMQMPVMDGYEAVQVLRGKGYDLPIIALTAHAMDGDRAKCIEAGCTDYATKPIDRHVLVATIAAFRNTSREDAPINVTSN